MDNNTSIRAYHHIPAGKLFGGEFSLPTGTFH
jgi:hypothetical protein